MTDIIGWTIVELLGSDHNNSNSYSREIQCFIREMPHFTSQAEAEIYLSKMDLKGRRLEIISLKPLRRSLPYQGIARRAIVKGSKK